MLLATFAGCLIDTEVYEQRKAELTDHDGDSFVQVQDCDDNDDSVFPGAAEVCDGIDQDCDGEADEAASDAPAWFPDADGDGFGDRAAAGTAACSAPAGTVANGLDCDDRSTAVNPAADETAYDGADQDCDGYDLTDVDGDGYDAEVVGGGDCDDGDGGVYQGATEGWFDDGIDNDCDGELRDPVIWSASESLTRIDGDAAGGELGRRLHYWVEGACMIANAPYAQGARGVVYGIARGGTGIRDVADAGVLTGTAESSFLSSTEVSANGRLAAAQVVDRDGEGTVFLLDAASLCSGSSGDVGELATLTIEGNEAGAWLGVDARWLNDVDGDGLDELAVVAPGASAGGVARGAAHIWLDPAIGVATDTSSADLVLTGSEDGSGLEAVTTAYDDDGPGVPWLLVGQMVSTAGTTGLFRVDARTASSGPVADSADAGWVTWSTGHMFSAVNIGDTDFDGADNLVAGVWTFGIWNIADLSGYQDESEAINYISYDVEGEWITGVAPAGDFDGDERADIAVLAEDWPQYAEQGRLALLSGERQLGPTIDFTSVQLVAEGSTAGDSFGYHAIPVGDFDGDGVNDIAVAAPGADHSVTGGGSVYLLPLP